MLITDRWAVYAGRGRQDATQCLFKLSPQALRK
jgi:hypothetical protein